MVGADLVALLEGFERADADPALEAGRDFAGVIVDAAQARDLTVIELRAVAVYAGAAAAAHGALAHEADVVETVSDEIGRDE